MSDFPEVIMLFAAGFGTRMGALTAHCPKPLIKVAGRALIDHALDLADGAGVAGKVVNLHYLAPMLAQHLAPRRDVALSHEAPMVLETGGGLKHALPLLGNGPVFTLNTDAVWAGGNPLEILRAAWRPGEMDALLLLAPVGRARGHKGLGDFTLLADGRLRRGGAMVYLGAQILCTDGLAAVEQPAFSLNLVWDSAMARGRVFGVLYPGLWCDVGQPESIALAEAMLAETGASGPANV